MLKIHKGLWKLKYQPGYLQLRSVPNGLKELKYRYVNYISLYKFDKKVNTKIYLTSLNQNSDTLQVYFYR